MKLLPSIRLNSLDSWWSLLGIFLPDQKTQKPINPNGISELSQGEEDITDAQEHAAP